jgi:uncharacterized protein (DUF488 family)
VRKTTLCTIGYEGKTPAEFVQLLKRARVSVLVDVRELPLSRRRGFSKTSLRTSLEAEGIAYTHLRPAGNPYRAQKADIQKCLRLYAGHLDRSPEVVELVLDEVRGRRAALLCFEAQPCDCHRSILAARMKASEPQIEIVNL